MMVDVDLIRFFLLVSISIILIENFIAIPSSSAQLGIESPRKQMAGGVLAYNVKCKADLVLILKTKDKSAACVTPQTANLLIDRGWGEKIPQKIERMGSLIGNQNQNMSRPSSNITQTQNLTQSSTPPIVNKLPATTTIKRIAIGTTWQRSNICGIQATKSNDLFSMAKTKITTQDFIASNDLQTVMGATNSGFETIAADGHTIASLQQFLSTHSSANFPAKYLSLDMTETNYTSYDVQTAASLIKNAGFKVAFSGPFAKPLMTNIAAVADLIVYEDQPTLVLQGEDKFLSNVRDASMEVKSINPNVIFLVFVPVRSGFNCSYTTDQALSAISSIKAESNVDGIVIYNWKDQIELATVMQNLGR